MSSAGRSSASVAAAVGLGLVTPLPTPPALRTPEPIQERPPSTAPALRLYVPNQSGASISVLDGSGALLATIDLRAAGFSEHAMPHQVAAEPDGSAWYATLAGDGHVARFDRNGELARRVEFDAPGMVVLDPGRDRLYVSRALSAVNPPTSLGVFRASDLTLLEEPEVFIARPHGLAVDTVSGRVYAASLSTGQIAALDPERGRVSVTSVEGSPGFVGLASSPDGTRLVATTQLTGKLLAFDATEPARLEAIASVPVAPGPYDVAFSPDGRSVWFPNQRANSVTRVAAGVWKVSATIRHEAFVEPHGVVLSPDGRTVYITSHGPLRSPAERAGESGEAGPQGASRRHGDRGNGTVAVLDAITGEVRAVTEVGPYAAAPGLAVVR